MWFFKTVGWRKLLINWQHDNIYTIYILIFYKNNQYIWFMPVLSTKSIFVELAKDSL
jgi:hypothetical protein